MFTISTWVVAGGVIAATLMLLGFIAQMYRKVGPNEAFIVYGAGGTRVIKGGGTVIFPMIHSYKTLPLELCRSTSRRSRTSTRNRAWP